MALYRPQFASLQARKVKHIWRNPAPDTAVIQRARNPPFSKFSLSSFELVNDFLNSSVAGHEKRVFGPAKVGQLIRHGNDEDIECAEMVILVLRGNVMFEGTNSSAPITW